MEIIFIFCVCIYFLMLLGMSCYGLHRYWMIYLFHKHKKIDPKPGKNFVELPKVTVQLPVYNEKYVVERLIDAVGKFNYPSEKLQIQVLDDSQDETTSIIATKVAALRRKGLDISHIHRTDRIGYKAGALANGFASATGEFIAIFDADFIPPTNLLHKFIHYFSDPNIGMVQSRWGHLNKNYSILTSVQSMLLDGHFMIEQTARARSGCFFNFNGTAGIWRRSCIEDSGGWHHDTLAEDLDLSYRAQLKGWKFLFLPTVVTPAELPIEMNAFKSQQHRWAKGSIQACKKLLPKLWRSPQPLRVKLEGTVHLTSNFAHLMLLLFCFVFHAPAMLGMYHIKDINLLTRLLFVDGPFFVSATISVTAFYLMAQRHLHNNWWRSIIYIPVLMAIGIGLSANNARGVIEGIFNHNGEFVRTPKYGVQDRDESWRRTSYRTLTGLMPYIELGFAIYFTYMLTAYIRAGAWSVLPFVIIFQIGFIYVGFMSLLQSRMRLPAAPKELDYSPARA